MTEEKTLRKKQPKTHSFSDAEGTKYIINSETREIVSTMDKHGFMYNSKGECTGNIHGHKYIPGHYY